MFIEFNCFTNSIINGNNIHGSLAIRSSYDPTDQANLRGTSFVFVCLVRFTTFVCIATGLIDERNDTCQKLIWMTFVQIVVAVRYGAEFSVRHHRSDIVIVIYKYRWFGVHQKNLSIESGRNVRHIHIGVQIGI